VVFAPPAFRGQKPLIFSEFERRYSPTLAMERGVTHEFRLQHRTL
jgi:hypothetical protein